MRSILAAANYSTAGLAWFMPAVSFQGPIAIGTPTSSVGTTAATAVMTSPTLPTGTRPRWALRFEAGAHSYPSVQASIFLLVAQLVPVYKQGYLLHERPQRRTCAIYPSIHGSPREFFVDRRLPWLQCTPITCLADVGGSTPFQTYCCTTTAVVVFQRCTHA